MRQAAVAFLVLGWSLAAHAAAIPAFDATNVPQYAGVDALKPFILNTSMILDVGLRTRQLSSDNPQNPARLVLHSSYTLTSTDNRIQMSRRIGTSISKPCFLDEIDTISQIGGADSCTFQPIAMFDDRDNFYEEYQLDSYNNCGGGV